MLGRNPAFPLTLAKQSVAAHRRGLLRKIGEDKIKHPFDGDGMVVAVSFSAEGVYFRNRFVKTKGYLKELEAGKQLYRGFTNLPGGFLVRRFRPNP